MGVLSENPFLKAKEIVEKIKNTVDIIAIDFHAEATAEKRAMGFYLDGRVSAVFGTHTHVITGDATILPKGTAYITDLGMCGPVQSVLGIEPELAIRKFKSNLPVRFENAKGEYTIEGCLLDIDEKTGKARSIKRILITPDKKEVELTPRQQLAVNSIVNTEKTAFASSIIERFKNPFANHQLLSISLNSISKFKVRNLPSLLDYLKITGSLPLSSASASQ